MTQVASPLTKIPTKTHSWLAAGPPARPGGRGPDARQLSQLGLGAPRPGVAVR
jgi:hypothetical protein